MYAYLLGLSLVCYGLYKLDRDTKEIDGGDLSSLESLTGYSLSSDPPGLRKLKLLGKNLALIFFFAGFFAYEWYVPILAVWIIPAALFFSPYASISSDNLLIVAKEQIGIVVGSVLCIAALGYSFLGNKL